jgi:hypothetical protein
VVSEILVEALESLQLQYPEPVENIASYTIPKVVA